MRTKLKPVRNPGPAKRSTRLPFYPGLPVPVIRLRGVKYPHDFPVSSRRFEMRPGPWDGYGTLHGPEF